LQHAGAVHALAFSADSKRIATASSDSTARLWDAATGAPLGPPLQHDSGVEAAAFSPSGAILATASSDGTIRFWDAATSRLVGPPISAGADFTTLAFHPDGTLLAATGRFASPTLWRVPAAVSGTAARIRDWTRYLTTMELDATDAARGLSAGDWERAASELESQGGLPELSLPANESEKSWHDRESAQSLRQARWFSACWHLDRLIAMEPNDASLRVSRARALMALGRPAEAEADYSQALALGAGQSDPRLYTQRGALRAASRSGQEADADFVEACKPGTDADPFLSHALLELERGDVTGFRESCQRMLELFGMTESPAVARQIALACALAPDAVADPGRAEQVAYRSLADAPDDRESLELLAALLYRAGRYAEALARLDQTGGSNPKAPNSYFGQVFKALAQDRLGQHQEARKWLGTTRGSQPSPASIAAAPWWSNFLINSLPTREAELQINEGRPLYLPARVFQD
jgi:Flp pilus assembly protein TadD